MTPLPSAGDHTPRIIDLTRFEANGTDGLRIGVVGCGYWGSKHVRVLHELSSVSEVAVIDPDRTRTDAILRTYPAVGVFERVEDCLDHLDALIVATPPSTHAEIAGMAMAAGLHVLVEKPMTTTSADAFGLIDLADANDLVLMVGHTFEYNPAVRHLRELVQSGELGDVLYLDSQRLSLGLYRPDVNVVWDLAPHDVSIANHLLGSTPTSVEAWGESHMHDGVEDVAYLRLRYEDLGVSMQAHVSWLSPSKVRKVTVVGDQKMAIYNDMADEDRLRIYDKGVQPGEQDLHGVPMSYRHGSITSPFVKFDEPLRLQAEEFVAAIIEGRQARTDGWSGLRVVQVMEAIDQALTHGGVHAVGEAFDRMLAG